MNKQQLDILEKAFVADIDMAAGGIGIFQQHSKVAQQLENDGYLRKVKIKLGLVTIEGYRLTDLGHIFYCQSERCK